VKLEDAVETSFKGALWKTYRDLRDPDGIGHVDVAKVSVNLPFPRTVAFKFAHSRSEFLEKRQHDHLAWAENTFGECCFVVSDGVAEANDVPEEWGLIELKNGEVNLLKKATTRNAYVTDLLKAIVAHTES